MAYGRHMQAQLMGAPRQRAQQNPGAGYSWLDGVLDHLPQRLAAFAGFVVDDTQRPTLPVGRNRQVYQLPAPVIRCFAVRLQLAGFAMQGLLAKNGMCHPKDAYEMADAMLDAEEA